jgi:hypothetical protein
MLRVMVALLLVVGGAVIAGEASAQATGPIKIGFLSPLSGAIAAAGKDMYSGCELYWQETGWQAAGRKIEVILEDNEGLPATALTKARKLVESDKVHVLAGVILSNVAYALVPYVEAQGIPTMYPINSAIGALRTVEVGDAPRGPVKMDPYGNPTQNIYIRKVERMNGVLQNTIVFTYPNVSQFWKYNPEEFLKQPVYSREFPPCRHC